MLFIEAHGHVWEKLHGRRLDKEKLLPLGNGKVSVGSDVIQFVPPEARDCVFPIEVIDDIASHFHMLNLIFSHRHICVK